MEIDLVGKWGFVTNTKLLWSKNEDLWRILSYFGRKKRLKLNILNWNINIWKKLRNVPLEYLNVEMIILSLQF